VLNETDVNSREVSDSCVQLERFISHKKTVKIITFVNAGYVKKRKTDASTKKSFVIHPVKNLG